jgi:DHA3 family macrolide efflux protein-like MFS transporter
LQNWKRNAALFLTGQALSLWGSMIAQYAIVWHVTLATRSGTAMTLFTIVGLLPMFFISPFAGVWADRFDRKRVINLADGSVAFASLIAALFLAAGVDSIWMLLSCVVVRSLGQGVQMPAVGSFIPDIVPAGQLTRVNGLQGSIQSFAALTAPATSGAMMTFVPLEALFFLDVATAIIGISIVMFLVKAPGKPTAAGSGERQGVAYFRDLKEGIRYMRSRGHVLRMIILSSAFFFLSAPAAFLTPLQVTRNFGDDVWRLSAIEILFSGGMLAGGLLISAWGGLKNRIHTMTLSCVLCGLLGAALGAATNFPLYLVITAALGVSLPLWRAPSMVLLQTTVNPAFMGRVLSVFAMAPSVMMPLGMVVFGPLADVISIDAILVATGVLISLLSIPLVTSKTLIKAGRASSS